MKNEENGFIRQTANDYDVSYELVENLYKNKETMYEKLEEIIKERKQ
jgi:hypothetical protein